MEPVVNVAAVSRLEEVEYSQNHIHAVKISMHYSLLCVKPAGTKPMQCMPQFLREAVQTSTPQEL